MGWLPAGRLRYHPYRGAMYRLGSPRGTRLRGPSPALHLVGVGFGFGFGFGFGGFDPRSIVSRGGPNHGSISNSATQTLTRRL